MLGLGWEGGSTLIVRQNRMVTVGLQHLYTHTEIEHRMKCTLGDINASNQFGFVAIATRSWQVAFNNLKSMNVHCDSK